MPKTWELLKVASSTQENWIMGVLFCSSASEWWRGLAGVLLLAGMALKDLHGAGPPALNTHHFRFRPDQPNCLSIPPQQARFVRVAIVEAESGQPCFDELEVYGPSEKSNLALASRGAKASASSCLPGYAIHQVAHLNDGLYGNSHSWIAAGSTGEWAQIELPETTTVSQIVISRDREGRYRDRLPAILRLQLSADGQRWDTVLQAGTRISLPENLDWQALLTYAFLCEQDTWSRVDSASPLKRVLTQFEPMLERLATKGLDVTEERKELEGLRQLLAEMPGETSFDSERMEPAYLRARLAKRRLFLRDPELAALQQIVFVARHPYEPSHNYSDILDAHWRPGGGIFKLEIPRVAGRLEPGSGKVNRLFDAGSGVARDPMPSFDAQRVYFAYRATPDSYFHLQVVNADGGGVRQFTDGPFHDYYPCPLPGGGLAFISTRCRARFLCWRPQAFVLFRMDEDGQNIRPLSHANLSEWAPSVMNDGRVLWTRSEYLDKGADFGHTLWAIRPDGTHPELIFGNNTLNCYVNAREVPNSDELCCTLISHGGDLNGPVALIRPGQGRFNPAAITNITPDSEPRYHMDWAQSECFRDPVPVARDYVLVSHAPQKHFALYVIDRFGNRELLYLDPKISCMAPLPLQPRPEPPLLSPVASTQPGEPGMGEFFLADVYRGLEPKVKRGSVKYLRICQEVRADLELLPDGSYRQDHPPFEDFYASPTHLVRGPHGWPSYVAKASLGLVPVSQDGSARFEAPAGKVLYFQVLDDHLNELQRMRSVVQLQPGEQRSCIGCHEHRDMAAPVIAAAASRSYPLPVEPPSWGAVPFSYPNVVQPVWDKHCVRCHNPRSSSQQIHADPALSILGPQAIRDAQKLDFSPGLDTDLVPHSYRTLITQGWVHYFDYTWGQEHRRAEPLSFGTLQSRLWKVLEAGHYGVMLTQDEVHRVKCWIDLNCPLWPDYIQRELRSSTVSVGVRNPPPEASQDLNNR